MSDFYETKLGYFWHDPLGYFHINKHLDLVQYYYEEATRLEARLEEEKEKGKDYMEKIKELNDKFAEVQKEVKQKDNALIKEKIAINSYTKELSEQLAKNKELEKKVKNLANNRDILNKQVKERDDLITQAKSVLQGE